ncbi:ABC transporter permease [Umezawaea endophytica]|uniref:ABC transporter permease n=1 Tax=Umezawaea endophytica TaxID=1654476 RepID=A0A9X3AH98_9PSEU|nr:ABC transporter permease [Umezawaea endophytica]MCS7481172.1 ABC transporter permease [Umezawaea endophytica]
MLRRDRWALAGAITVAVLGVAAVAADLLTAIEGQDPYTYRSEVLDPQTGGPAGALGGVSGEHWFGVEPLSGRDLFAIVVHGARTSFLIGLAATAVSVVLGVLIGAGAGYLGGWVDRVVTWIADVFLGFPYLVFMIALGAVVPSSVSRPLLLIVVIGFFGWPSIARIVRAQVLTLKKRNFVSAARILGASPRQVFRAELLPNLWAPIIVVATLSIPGKIGLEAALSFLGVGIPQPTPSWGRAISTAVEWVVTDPMFLFFPGGALFLATWGFTVFGDGLRDALDPKTEVRR